MSINIIRYNKFVNKFVWFVCIDKEILLKTMVKIVSYSYYY